MTTFDATTAFANDWQYYDKVIDAVYTPADASGLSQQSYNVKVTWFDRVTPQYSGAQMPLSPTQQGATFWKGKTLACPDPVVDGQLKIEGVEYRINRVQDYRNGQFGLALTEELQNIQ